MGVVGVAPGWWGCGTRPLCAVCLWSCSLCVCVHACVCKSHEAIKSLFPFACLPVDAIFAVYEASSLELWSFMEYTALDGSPQRGAGIFFTLFYYSTLVFFLVIFVQVCKAGTLSSGA